MAILEPAADELQPYFDRLVDEHGIYGHFKKHGVRIDWLFAITPTDEDGNKTGPALKVGGYPAIGQCRIVGYRDRVKGCGDIEITIDQDWWSEATDQERLAVMDHELYHAMIVTTQSGLAEVDDHGRPKIKIRKHDQQFGWFGSVAQRWGAHSQEVQQAKALREKHEQTFMDFTYREPTPKEADNDDTDNVVAGAF